ncbi:ABC transporter permease [Jiangella asiatica]|uniref:ABC transporter permease subunit n=1 Tax=Jiangella asiatica TaxID=2530372 RepID=A0A4R5DTA7_9ACTN|nr:ABC transporter permease subunit [Jiangella asiatica]TDE14365.1 ABC transporter permease subunit [Jiangella asiatica]
MSSTTAARTEPRSVARAALWLRAAFVLAVLVLWEVLAEVGVVDEEFASRPSAVFQALGHLAVDSQALGAAGETMAAFLTAFAIGTGAGIVTGVVFGLNRLLRDAYFPIVMVLMVVPKSVFLPLLVLFFGLGATAGIAFGVLLAFVHVTVNVVAGLDLVEQKFYDVGRAYGARPTRLFLDVILPGAAPGIFAGIWHGIRNGFVGVVIAQLFVSTNGIGYLVRLYSNNFQIDNAMALTLAMAALVILTGSLWSRLESHLTRWRD